MNRDKLEPDKRRHLLIVISVAFSSFMSGLNNYIVNVSLPTISNYFNAGTGEISRVILAYLLTLTSSLLLFGQLGDRIGLKRVFITGYTVFTAGSLLCGLSAGINTLVGFRLLQGLGAAMLSSSGFAIIAKYLPPDQTGRSYGIVSASVALGITAGAPLGGLITGYLAWQWIFFVNVPIGMAAIITAAQCIPGDQFRKGSHEEGKKSFDVPGAVLSFFGLATLLYGINTGKAMGWTSPPIVISFTLAIVLLTLFVVRELRCKSPLLDFTLFRNRTLVFALLATSMVFMWVAGNTFLLPFYLEIVKHLTIQQTSMVLFLYAVVHVIFSPRVGRLADRVRPGKLCAVGLASASLSTFFFSYTLRLNSMAYVLVFAVWIASSYVFFFAPNSKQIMRLAPRGRQGSASGVMNTTAFLSMIFGVALFEKIFSHGFSNILPKGVSLLRAGIPAPLLIQGFSTAYFFGGFVCLLAFAFSLAGRDRKI
jgi:EmrB/QacA subfamily drug resistance transporter